MNYLEPSNITELVYTDPSTGIGDEDYRIKAGSPSAFSFISHLFVGSFIYSDSLMEKKLNSLLILLAAAYASFPGCHGASNSTIIFNTSSNESSSTAGAAYCAYSAFLFAVSDILIYAG